MIKTFRNRETYQLFLSGMRTKLPGDIVERARRKLMALDATSKLNDLWLPPSNRLEGLRP
jgi:proteic killer suppression protein